MAFIPAVNTALVTIVARHETNNKEAVNTLWFQGINPLDTGQLADLADALETWVTDHYAPLVVNDWRFVNIKLRDMTTQFGAEYSLNIDEPGLVNSDALPSNVTIAVSFRTGLAGRSFRGRNYLIGLPRSAVLDDNVLDAAVTNINNAFEQLITVGSGLDFTWVVASHYTNGAPRATALLTPITFVTLTDSEVDHQDRRLRAP